VSGRHFGTAFCAQALLEQLFACKRSFGTAFCAQVLLEQLFARKRSFGPVFFGTALRCEQPFCGLSAFIFQEKT